MKTYVALFRGINVVGSHLLPMRELKLLLERNGCIDVQTYIQSGNAVFRSSMSDTSRLTTQLTAAVSRSHGFEPRVVILTHRELESAAAGNPFSEADQAPRRRGHRSQLAHRYNAARNVQTLPLSGHFLRNQAAGSPANCSK